jgi:hypothetical protein
MKRRPDGVSTTSSTTRPRGFNDAPGAPNDGPPQPSASHPRPADTTEASRAGRDGPAEHDSPPRPTSGDPGTGPVARRGSDRFIGRAHLSIGRHRRARLAGPLERPDGPTNVGRDTAPFAATALEGGQQALVGPHNHIRQPSEQLKRHRSHGARATQCRSPEATGPARPPTAARAPVARSPPGRGTRQRRSRRYRSPWRAPANDRRGPRSSREARHTPARRTRRLAARCDGARRARTRPNRDGMTQDRAVGR